MEISDFKKKREQIEEAKTKKARAEGSLAESMARLKKEYGLDNLSSAEKEIAKLQVEIDADEKKLEEMMVEIENSIDWSKI